MVGNWRDGLRVKGVWGRKEKIWHTQAQTQRCVPIHKHTHNNGHTLAILPEKQTEEDVKYICAV